MKTCMRVCSNIVGNWKILKKYCEITKTHILRPTYFLVSLSVIEIIKPMGAKGLEFLRYAGITNRLTLLMKLIAVYSENYIKSINTLHRKNVDIFTVDVCGTYSMCF
jgi:hypothetical protein